MSIVLAKQNKIGIIDHGNLNGLEDDDHTQYLLADGSRNLEGHLTLTGSIYFTDTNTQIGEDGSSNLYFKDANAGTLTLSDLKSKQWKHWIGI